MLQFHSNNCNPNQRFIQLAVVQQRVQPSFTFIIPQTFCFPWSIRMYNKASFVSARNKIKLFNKITRSIWLKVQHFLLSFYYFTPLHLGQSWTILGKNKNIIFFLNFYITIISNFVFILAYKYNLNGEPFVAARYRKLWTTSFSVLWTNGNAYCLSYKLQIH